MGCSIITVETQKKKEKRTTSIKEVNSIPPSTHTWATKVCIRTGNQATRKTFLGTNYTLDTGNG